MAHKDYIVLVYDCSFVQDYVNNYQKTFDTEKEAREYADTLMSDFSYRGLYEYTCEIGIHTGQGLYNVFGFWEFDCNFTDADICEVIEDMYDDNGCMTFSYHDMF